MRTFLSWAIGFAVFIVVGLGLTFVGETIGVPSSIDLDGPTTITHGGGRYSYDEEVSSLQTSFGYASGGFALLIGLWAGQALFHGKKMRVSQKVVGGPLLHGSWRLLFLWSHQHCCTWRSELSMEQ